MATSIGFVNNIKRKNAKQIVTVVLNYEELRTQSLILGAFMIVSGRGRQRYLARVEECYYAPVTLAEGDTNKALAMGRLNNETDQSSVKYINFLHYDLVLLGEIETNSTTNQLQFFPGIREVPSLMDITVRQPTVDELQQIVNLKIIGTQQGGQSFQLGRLQYGTRVTGDARTPALPSEEIPVNFNISNLYPKRTAVFGKTGYGKSNLVKALMILVKIRTPNISQLIFDVNGEYAFSNRQDKGLLDLFTEINSGDSIVVYSNRTDAQKQYSHRVKPIKFDVIENPEMAAALVIGKRSQRSRQTADYLETLADPNMHETVRAFWRCFCVEELDLAHDPRRHRARYKRPKKERDENPSLSEYIDDFQEAHGAILKASNSDTVKSLRGKTGQFSFLKRLHYLSHQDSARQRSQHTGQSELALDNIPSPSQLQPTRDVFTEIRRDLSTKKIVILDLPSIDSSLLTPFSNKLATDLFHDAQETFLIKSVNDDPASGSSKAPVLMYVEEAHNVLSEETTTIFPRIAREGRKYGIGMVYLTQRPGSIDEDILTQTENYFVLHVGSEEDAKQLVKAKIAFDRPISDFILTEPAVGVAYIYSEPYQPFVIPCRVQRFTEIVEREYRKGSTQSES